MAGMGRLFFNQLLKNFLQCNDLNSSKGIALTKKIRQSAKNSLEKIIEAIPTAPKPHSKLLKKICIEHNSGKESQFFLDELNSEHTQIRSTVVDILSASPHTNSAKLFKLLHEPDAATKEIIDILEAKKDSLHPDQLVNNALKLDKLDAQRLLQIAQKSNRNVDFSVLKVVPANIQSLTMKIMLLRYFSTLKQPEASTMIGKFLIDNNKTIIIEALKALDHLQVDYDASVVLPFIEAMSETEQKIALEILQKHANEALVPQLAPWTMGKSEALREIFIKMVAKYATEDGLRRFLLRIEQGEWWGRDQVIKTLINHNSAALSQAAKALSGHESEFVRSACAQLITLHDDDINLEKMSETALHESWQVREKALEILGKSGKRESLVLLRKSYDHWPESAVAVLRAVKQLGFSKGLELAFLCMKTPEALVQREALETIAAISNNKHAENIRNKLLAMVPKLEITVRDTAHEVLLELTQNYGLSELKIDDAVLFETRLIKLEENKKNRESSLSSDRIEPTIALSSFDIDNLKPDYLWLERFRIIKEIGRGAMGRVMLAQDEIVDEKLVLKFMHPELTAEKEARERFLREVKYARKISHDNVIRIHDMLFNNNLSAISMEYFESKGVDKLLTEMKIFAAKPGLDIIYQIAAGMSAAHKQNVIHRDLKPSNIMMNEQGLVKVVDFGVASASAGSDSMLTKTGLIIGTPAYLSPERAKGMEASNLCDIYALGILAYRMFSGRMPYKGEPMAVLFQHIKGGAPAIHQINKKIGARVSLLVQRMMAVDAENRIQTMDEVCESVKEVLQKL